MLAQPKYKPRVLVATVVGLAMIGFLGLFIWSAMNQERPAAATLPAQSDVEKMSATINDLETSFGISQIPLFDIPPEHYGVILRVLSRRDEHTPRPSSGLAIGEIDIGNKNGTTVRVVFYATGKNPLCFSVDQRLYTRGGAYRPVFVSGDYEGYADEGMLFYHILRAIHQKGAIGGQGSDHLKPYLDELRRSMGELQAERRDPK